MQQIARAGAVCAGLWLGFSGAPAAPAEDFFAPVAAAPYPAVQPPRAAYQAPARRQYAASRPATKAAAEIGWHTLARSIEDRVVEYAQFGQGELQALVVAPLAGDESEGGEIVERLASHLAHFPRSLTNTTVTIVRDPNPDGRFRHASGNARGVLLDQNFATRHWRRTPSGNRWLSGREPESEPETRALVELLTDLKPQRILVLGSERRPPLLQYAGSADVLAGQFAQSAHVRPSPLDPVDAAGSLAAYAGLDRDIPTLVFRVTTRSSAEQNWLRYKRALLSFLDEPAAPTDSQREARDPQAGEEAAAAQEEPRRLTTPAMPIALQSRAAPNQLRSEEASESAPGVLSAADLEQGAPLVPVGRPPEMNKPAVPPSAPAQTPAQQPRSFQPPSQNVDPATNGRPGSYHVPSPRPGATIRRPTMQAPRSQAAPSAASGMFAPPIRRDYPTTRQTQPARAAVRAPLASPAPARETAAPRVQRLPKVDPTPPPPARDLRQQPIPFYPDTGY